jgi:hypothetical protein
MGRDRALLPPQEPEIGGQRFIEVAVIFTADNERVFLRREPGHAWPVMRRYGPLCHRSCPGRHVLSPRMEDVRKT